jgi:hypothetical protein
VYPAKLNSVGKNLQVVLDFLIRRLNQEKLSKTKLLFDKGLAVPSLDAGGQVGRQPSSKRLQLQGHQRGPQVLKELKVF